MTSQVAQISFAILIVGAFASLQLRLVQPGDRRYLVANLVGSGGLLVVAVGSVELGFVITNALWVIVSAAGLVRATWREETRQTL